MAMAQLMATPVWGWLAEASWATLVQSTGAAESMEMEWPVDCLDAQVAVMMAATAVAW